MNILIASDKFKDSLSAQQVIEAITKGIRRVDRDCNIKSLVLSDGGDGFLDTIQQNIPDLGLMEETTVDALNRRISTNYAYNVKTNSIYIELAQSSGLVQLPANKRNALYTSTYGTGLIIKSALNTGCDKLFVGLGGSATNDGGCGIAAALGYKFLNASGQEFIPTAIDLIEIDKIIFPENLFYHTELFAINDVTNPLIGDEGATYIYGPQKGLKQEDLSFVELGMLHLSSKVKEFLKMDIASLPGSGAAGGAAFGLKAFFGAKFIRGIDFILNSCFPDLNEIFMDLDLIITGEGKIDKQTASGKLIQGISSLAQQYQVPIVAFCGKCDLDEFDENTLGLKRIIEISDSRRSLEYNLNYASKLLEEKAYEYFNDKSNSFKK